MKKQQKPWWCSAASLQNAFKFYGGDQTGRTQKAIADIVGVTDETNFPDDTTPGVKRAILHFGFSYDELHTAYWDEALNWLNDAVMMPRNGHPIMMCVKDWSHWIVLLGAAGCRTDPRYILFDCANYDYLKREHGLYIWDKQKRMKEWRASYKTGKDIGACTSSKPYYALAVIK